MLPVEGVNVESVLTPQDAGAHRRGRQGHQRGAAQAAPAPRRRSKGNRSWNSTHVIKGPLITEKLDKAREKQRQYSFVVDRKATKHDVARAVSTLFKVTVEDVRTLIMRGKIKRVGMSMGKRSNFKKAFVTLKEGDKIELFEGGTV